MRNPRHSEVVYVCGPEVGAMLSPETMSADDSDELIARGYSARAYLKNFIAATIGEHFDDGNEPWELHANLRAASSQLGAIADSLEIVSNIKEEVPS